ncbi:MAG: nucleotide sugar dehydrogenase [Candidatus Velthaea sp.]
MNVGVVGLWHLGTVTAACLAAAGHTVVAVDTEAVVAPLAAGEVPVAEPGLAELVAAQRTAGRLEFGSDLTALRVCELVWITYDTPIDAFDCADVEFVVERIRAVIDCLDESATIAVSSQLPVGSVARLERIAAAAGKSGSLTFASIPENLRLGSAIAYFRTPDRMIVGVRDTLARERIARMLAPFVADVKWMRTESAEMTKHALNGFLATSVAFMNEIGAVCERVGADAREVEIGLKSDVRIGPKAYLRAGQAFAGGTLARDLAFLAAIGERTGVGVEQLTATQASNQRHKDWLAATVGAALAGSGEPAVALLGLVYKPGTDTLRASTALELARRLREAGVRVSGFDPAIAVGRGELAGIVDVAVSAAAALLDADVAVVATPWPAFRDLRAADFAGMRGRTLVDPDRFLDPAHAALSGLTYVAFGVGAPDAAVAHS